MWKEEEREALLAKLLDSYTAYYDVEQAREEEAPLVARAYFHEHGEKYVISHKAKLWTADQHEYVCIYTMSALTGQLVEECLNQTREWGLGLVKPEKDHMCSYVAAVFLCDEASEDAVSRIRKCRYRKSFQFSLQGWMELHAVLVNRSSGEIVSNPDGRESAKLLKDVFEPPKKKRRLFRSRR